MAIKFHCAACGQKIGVADDAAGHHVRCKTCGEVQIVAASPPHPAATPAPELSAWSTAVPPVSSRFRKTCALCATDITFAKRFRQANGELVCATCHEQANAASPPAATAPPLPPAAVPVQPSEDRGAKRLLPATLEHPPLARTYDSHVDHGVYFYAVELNDGVPLDQFVSANQLTQRQIVELMKAVCQGVQQAHRRGVVHGHLLPDNILVSTDGQPFILDFGPPRGSLPQETFAAVNVELKRQIYMSPEQTAGMHALVDVRTDVYSLGVILYRLLTGQHTAHTPLKSPRQLNPAVGKEMQTLLLKALAQKPEARYATAGDLAVELGNYLAGTPLTALPATPLYLLRKRCAKHRLPVALAVVMTVIALGMAGFACWSYLRVPPEPARMAAALSKVAQAQAQARDSQAQTDAAAAKLRDLRTEYWQLNQQLQLATKNLADAKQANALAATANPTPAPAPPVNTPPVSIPPAPVPPAAPSPAESTAAAKLANLQTTVQRSDWTEALNLLHELKDTYGQTAVVRGAADKLAAWDAAITQGMKTDGTANAQEAADLLKRVRAYIVAGDFLRASLALARLRQDRYAQTSVVQNAAAQIPIYQRDVDANLSKDQTQYFDQYILGTNTNSAAWRAVLLDPRNAPTGVIRGGGVPVFRGRSVGYTVVRARVEDETADQQLGVNTALPLTLQDETDLFTSFRHVDNGQWIMVLAANGGFAPATGDLKFEALRHYSAAVSVTVTPNSATPFGDLLLRRLPPDKTGDLVVNVKNEEGLDLTGGSLAIGQSSPWASVADIGRVQQVALNGIGEGPYMLRASGPTYGGMSAQNVRVKPLDTTTIDIPVFALRKIEFDWWYRRLPAQNWQQGNDQCDSGNIWTPKTWSRQFGVPCRFADWSENGCQIEPMMGFKLAPLPDFRDVATVVFPDESAFTAQLLLPVKEGAAFALTSKITLFNGVGAVRNLGVVQAIIQIRKITPLQPGGHAKPMN